MEHGVARIDPGNLDRAISLFDRQERIVLLLAARDPAGSIAFDKRRAKGWRALIFGAPYNYCLANGRLEVLRVTAIRLRAADFPAEQFYRFRLAGYSRAQFDALVALYAHPDLRGLASSSFNASSSFDIVEVYAEAA